MTGDYCCNPLQAAGVSHRSATNEVRRSAFSAVRAGAPASLSELSARTGQPLPVVRAVVTELAGAGLATVYGETVGDAVVDGVDGLTVRTTRHRLTLACAVRHTWCGFDTVGIPAALRVDAMVHTDCPACGSSIDLVLTDGQTPESVVVGWWPQPSAGPVIETFCPTASLFCNREHLDRWRQTTSAAGEALPLRELAERGRVTWSLFTDPEEEP